DGVSGRSSARCTLPPRGWRTGARSHPRGHSALRVRRTAGVAVPPPCSSPSLFMPRLTLGIGLDYLQVPFRDAKVEGVPRFWELEGDDTILSDLRGKAFTKERLQARCLCKLRHQS